MSWFRAKMTRRNNQIFLCSKGGMASVSRKTRFAPMGRAARGVIGMSLDEGDQVVAMEVLATSWELMASP